LNNSETDGRDRRRHERHPAEIQVHGSPEDGGVVARMVTRNLSLGGLYCTSTKDFQEMTRLAVRLMLPVNGSGGETESPLDIEAVVVRREELPSINGDPRYDLALFFTDLKTSARDHLRRFLEG
jgi:hypothetical protein